MTLTTLKTDRRAWWADEEFAEPAPKTMQVIEDDQPRWSGLYDATGQKLFREPAPFGFRRKV